MDPLKKPPFNIGLTKQRCMGNTHFLLSCASMWSFVMQKANPSLLLLWSIEGRLSHCKSCAQNVRRTTMCKIAWWTDILLHCQQACVTWWKPIFQLANASWPSAVSAWSHPWCTLWHMQWVWWRRQGHFPVWLPSQSHMIQSWQKQRHRSMILTWLGQQEPIIIWLPM